MIDNQDRLGNRTDESELRYLRAADYAQQGQYAEAEQEFIAVLEMNPSLHTARFQLGLLQLTCGKPDQARATWAPLHQASVAADLQHFSAGLEALICDDFQASINLLSAGIELNKTNPALNKDMAMVIGKIKATVGTPTAPPNVKTAEETTGSAVRTDFSLYGDKAK